MEEDCASEEPGTADESEACSVPEETGRPSDDPLKSGIAKPEEESPTIS